MKSLEKLVNSFDLKKDPEIKKEIIISINSKDELIQIIELAKSMNLCSNYESWSRDEFYAAKRFKEKKGKEVLLCLYSKTIFYAGSGAWTKENRLARIDAKDYTKKRNKVKIKLW